MLVHPTLLFASLVIVVVASTYAFVGFRLSRRHGLEGDALRVMRLFAIWWWATAANLLLGAGIYAAAAWGFTDLSLQMTYGLLQRLLLSVSMVGLMTYMVYLFTGRMRLMPIAFVYGGYYVFLLTLMMMGQPDGVTVGRWRTDLSYAHETRPLLMLLNFAFLVLPPVAAALGYFRLYFHVETTTQKYRIALVSWSIVAWWLVAVLAGQRAAVDDDALQIANRVVGLAAAVAILLAYEPPAWVRRRFGIRPLADARD